MIPIPLALFLLVLCYVSAFTSGYWEGKFRARYPAQPLRRGHRCVYHEGRCSLPGRHGGIVVYR